MPRIFWSSMRPANPGRKGPIRRVLIGGGVFPWTLVGPLVKKQSDANAKGPDECADDRETNKQRTEVIAPRTVCELQPFDSHQH